MKNDVFIEGSFRTITPLTYKSPDFEDLPTIAGQYYLPASAIRGRLRRCARDVVIHETGWKPGFRDFYFLSVGGMNLEGKRKDDETQDAGESSQAKESYAIPVYQKAEEINPLISLFGAGPGSPLAIPSKLFVSHAMAPMASSPSLVISKVAPCRTDDARMTPAQTSEAVADGFLREYLRYTGEQREQSALKSRKNDLIKTIRKTSNKEEKEALQRAINEIEKQLSEKPVSISNPALSYQVINPGVTLTVRMRALRVSDTEMTLLLRAFERLAAYPYFGGRKASGNGMVAGEFTLSMRPHSTIESPKEVGRLEWQDDASGLKAEGMALQWLRMPIPYDRLSFAYEALAEAASSRV